MKPALAALFLLMLSSAIYAAPRAALCASDVPKQTCEAEKNLLIGLQTTYLASDVQFVIADDKSYIVEHPELATH